MKLLDFLNENENWQNILSEPPYSLSIKNDGIYYILKYNMLDSDLSIDIVQEARGSIFRFDDEVNKWICVCHPFDKFFNYSEPNAVEIDWKNNPTIYDKLDGSLIKCWYDLGSWHISTNGVINAENAEVEGFSGTLNFLTLFKSAFGRENQLEKCYKFLNSLNKEYTYMFELVSPSNRLVVKYYFDKLYALSRRNKITDFEEPFNDYELSLFFNYGIEIPKVFNFDTIEDVIESARQLTLDNEGYVVCDKNYNRVKIKGEEYLKAFKIRGNLKITKKKVVQAILGGYIDDMIGFFGDEPKVTDTVEEFKNIKKDFESAWECIKKLNLPTRKDYAEEIKKLGAYSSYCFFKLNNPDKTLDDFIGNMHIDKLMLLFE